MKVTLWLRLMRTGMAGSKTNRATGCTQSIMTSDSTSPSYLAGENNRLSDMRSRGWYVSPLLADENNTREERIEAMISTAYEYYGDTYKACYSQL